MEYRILLIFMIFLGSSKVASNNWRNKNSCTYSFNVWKPDNDALRKINEIDLRLENVTGYIDREILKFRNTALEELRKCENWTAKLEKDLLLYKYNGDTIGNSKSNNDIDSIKNDLIKIQNDVESLRHESGSRETNRDLRDLTSNDDVTFGMLQDSVIDLKAEWILVKRDIFDIHKDLAHLRKGQNDIHNDTQHLFNSVTSLTKSTVTMESKLDHSTTKLFLLNSNVNELKKMVVNVKEQEDNKMGDISEMKKDIDEIRQNVEKQKNDAESFRVKNSYPKPLRTSAYKSKDVLRKSASIASDCEDIFKQGYTSSGVYQIRPNNSKYMDGIYCEFINDTAYTVIQRRVDGLLNFDRRWIEYKFGFGNLYGEHWIGNSIIHLMSTQRRYVLRIDIWDWEGERGYAEYSNFRVDDDEHQFQLHVSGYTGNIGDSLSYHNDMKFSTEDSDNDLNMRNCAVDNKSGWWFNKCYLANLNGIYRTGWYTRHAQSIHSDGVVWYTWKDSEHYSLRKVEMKLRRAT